MASKDFNFREEDVAREDSDESDDYQMPKYDAHYKYLVYTKTQHNGDTIDWVVSSIRSPEDEKQLIEAAKAFGVVKEIKVCFRNMEVHGGMAFIKYQEGPHHIQQLHTICRKVEERLGKEFRKFNWTKLNHNNTSVYIEFSTIQHSCHRIYIIAKELLFHVTFVKYYKLERTGVLMYQFDNAFDAYSCKFLIENSLIDIIALAVDFRYIGTCSSISKIVPTMFLPFTRINDFELIHPPFTENPDGDVLLQEKGQISTAVHAVAPGQITALKLIEEMERKEPVPLETSPTEATDLTYTLQVTNAEVEFSTDQDKDS